jgi:hypothetical protein
MIMLKFNYGFIRIFFSGPQELIINSKYQNIRLITNKLETSLYLNGSKQWGSADVSEYHQLLVDIPIEISLIKKEVLILGGGDGLPAKHALQNSNVKKITVVEIDKEVINLAKNNKTMLSINGGSMNDPRVVVVIDDVVEWLQKNNKSLVIDISEVQFSKDVVITDTVIFQTYGFVEVFAPQLVDNPYPAGTRIPIKAFKYKSMNDYLNAAYKSYPAYPAMGGNSWRGQQQEVVVFDWDYQRSLALTANYGMEVKIHLEHDTAFGGSYATASMYCGLV